MPRLFKDGDKVFHLSKGKTGRVVAFIGGEECRYLVSHSGFTWSVPQAGLDSETAKNRT